MIRWLAVLVCLLACGPADADTFPSRPLTLIVPFAAGGPLDVLARTIAEGARADLGQPIIIENVTGAGGSIGFARLARSAPDGYAFGLGMWSTHVVNPVIYKLDYDVVADFAPIGLLVNNLDLVTVRKDLPVTDLASLVAWVRANPGQATWGTQGVGGPSHVAGLLFRHMTGTDIRLVNYRGLAPAMQDLVAGHIDIVVPATDIALPLVRAGQVRALAATGRQRIAAAPEVPTVDEAGLPGFYISVWTGLWAPKGTPEPIIARLNKAVMAVLDKPGAAERFAAQGQIVYPVAQQTPEALVALQKAEIETWWPILRAADVKGPQ